MLIILKQSGLLVAYTVEIMPFKLRAKGLMIMNFWIQVALVITQYVNPLGFKHLQPNWKLYTIYTVSLIDIVSGETIQLLTLWLVLDWIRACLCLLSLRRDSWSNSGGNSKDL
jgi:hypothetical protein